MHAGTDPNKNPIPRGIPFEGAYPLHLAVLKGSSGITKILIDSGADIDIKAKNQDEAPPLHWAVFFIKDEMVTLLVELGSSINELVKISNFDNNKKIIVSTCGVNPKIVKKYFKLKGYSNVHFAHPDEADYIIMTNRVVLDTDFKTMTNCFDKFKGENVFIVKRKGLLLSVIRKIT